VRHGGFDLGHGGLHVEFHHELARLVGLGGDLAVVEVGRQRGEACGGDAARDVLDVVVETPPLLDHDDAGEGTVALGPGQVALKRLALPVAGVLGHPGYEPGHGRLGAVAPRRLVDHGRGGLFAVLAGRQQHPGGRRAAQRLGGARQKGAPVDEPDLERAHQLHHVNAIHRSSFGKGRSCDAV